MWIIELNTKKPNIPKLDTLGNESTIYINGNTLYKIFNDVVNCQVKLDSIDFIEKKQKYVKGVNNAKRKAFF